MTYRNLHTIDLLDYDALLLGHLVIMMYKNVAK